MVLFKEVSGFQTAYLVVPVYVQTWKLLPERTDRSGDQYLDRNLY